jgi:monooxygenase
VDGVPVDLPEKVAFKGFLLSDVPNFAYVFGYTNSSWTLKVGLVCEHFCRLLAHMDDHGHTICYPQPPASMPTRPLLEINSGYAKRAAGLLPHQGTEGPWRTSMEYRVDRKMLREGPVDDDNLRFATSSAADALEPALAG